MKRSEPEKAALKALVTMHGPREAARVAGIPFGTVSAMCFKYKWKKAAFTALPASNSNLAGKDAADVIRESLERARNDSTLNLAKYVDNASRKAAQSKDPLEVARKVRDVAGVHQIIFPREEEGGLIEGEILIGAAKVTINSEEVAARAKEIPNQDVWPELSDQRPGGD
jgi:hypothetical protein